MRIGIDKQREDTPGATANVSRLLYRAPYCDIIVLARFSGNIPLDTLKTILRKTRRKYPLMGARVEQDTNGAARFAFDNVPEFESKALIKNNDMEWLELAWNEQKIPFVLNKGPLIKFLLLTSGDTTDLVVICHHSICDGLSLTYLLNDVALLLTNPDTELDQLPLPPAVMMKNLSVHVSPDWFVKLLITYLNYSWRKEKVVFDENDYEHLYTNYWKTKNIGLMSFSFSQDITSGLIARCDSEHVTVNSALTVALTLAQNDLQGRKESYLRKALLALNVRDLFLDPPGKNFGLLALGTEISLPEVNGSFWDIAQEFNYQNAYVTLESSDVSQIYGSVRISRPNDPRRRILCCPRETEE